MRVPSWLVIALATCLLAASSYPAPNFTQVEAGLTSGGAGVLPLKMNADADGVTGHAVVDVNSGAITVNTPAPCTAATCAVNAQTGGTSTAAIAAAAGATTVVSSTARRVWSFLATTAGTVALICYDNASASSGTIVLQTPATTVAGTEYGPITGRALVNGLTCNSAAGAPAGTFSLN